jgi:hypothetical protein
VKNGDDPLPAVSSPVWVTTGSSLRTQTHDEKEKTMRISSAFPSEYLKAADLQGRNIRVVIGHVEMRDVGDDHKPVLFFQGKEKGLVLNKTNANNVALIYGDDTEEWTGKEVILFEATVDFQGRSVPAIRIRSPQPKDRKPEPKSAGSAHAQARDGMDDEIPF